MGFKFTFHFGKPFLSLLKSERSVKGGRHKKPAMVFRNFILKTQLQRILSFI
jgi:hypothetical protein